MLRKSVFAFVVVAFSVGIICADTFPALITKVDGDNVTFKKGKKADKKVEYASETMTLPAAKAEIMKKGKKGAEGKMLKDGLTNKMFSGEIISKTPMMGIPATITTSDDGKSITKIEVGGGKGGKGKKKKDNGQ